MTEAKQLDRASAARSLLASTHHGVVSLWDGHYPYAATTDYVILDDGDILLLWSHLAVHTRIAEQYAAVALHVAPFAGEGDSLVFPRILVQGDVRRVAREDGLRQHFLDVVPESQVYIDFADFQFFRMRIRKARYIGGFGQMGWVEGDALRLAQADLLAPVMVSAIRHMNADHAHNLRDMARFFLAVGEPDSAILSGIDRFGLDLVVKTAGEASVQRIDFSSPLSGLEQLRPTLVEMSQMSKQGR